MYLLKSFLLLVSPLAVFGYLAAVKQNHSLWLSAGGILLVYLLATLWYVGRGRWNRNFFHFAILPLMFIVSGTLFVWFLVNPYVYYALAALIAGGVYLLLRQYYHFLHFPFRYVPYSLENLSYYLGVSAVFFAAGAAFAAHMLLRFALWQVALIMIMFVSVVLYQFFWINKISFQKSAIFIAVGAVVCGELFLALSFLPTSHFVNALVLALAYYLLVGLSKYFCLDQLDRKKTAGYLTAAGIALIALLLTARWN